MGKYYETDSTVDIILILGDNCSNCEVMCMSFKENAPKIVWMWPTGHFVHGSEPPTESIELCVAYYKEDTVKAMQKEIDQLREQLARANGAVAYTRHRLRRFKKFGR